MEKLEKYYKWLHQNPELSFCEHKTQQYILSALEGVEGIECKKVATTGVMAVIGESTMPTVVFRADIDALPINESTKLSYSSNKQGVMHACGHDMHTAILMYTLQEIAKNPPKNRCIIGLFQPAEEVVPGGAIKVIEGQELEKFNIKAIIAQHISPELEVGTIGICSGEFMASCDEIRLSVEGQGGHAAQPQDIIDPVFATTKLMGELYKIREKYKDYKIILTFGNITAKGATNVIPNRVEIEGTLRTFNSQVRVDIQQEIYSIAQKIDAELGTKTLVDIAIGYPPTINDPQLTLQIEEILSGDDFSGTIQKIERRMTAEDFGRYASIAPCCMVRLGVGRESGCGLHSAEFFPSIDALKFGFEIFHLLVHNLHF